MHGAAEWRGTVPHIHRRIAMMSMALPRGL